jgi:regulator of replication initiation timing
MAAGRTARSGMSRFWCNWHSVLGRGYDPRKNMLNQLHNEIDELEDLRERAGEIVRDIVENELEEILEEASDDAEAGDIMVAIAERVEERLTDLTTEAFHVGVGFAAQRRDA